MSTRNNNRNTGPNGNDNGYGAYNVIDDYNEHEENRQFLREYLQPDRSYTVFPLNIGHFEIKSGVI